MTEAEHGHSALENYLYILMEILAGTTAERMHFTETMSKGWIVMWLTSVCNGLFLERSA